MSEELVTVCNGKYKCAGPLVCCVAGIPKIVTNLNVTLEVCLYPEGDTTQTPIPTGLVFTPGLTNVLFTDGTYLLKGVDCEKLDGTVAPDDGTAIIVTCCQMDSKGGLSEYVAMGIDDICQKLLAIAEGSDNTELVAEIQALCAKILAGNALTASMVAELQALCQKLEASLEADAALVAEVQALCSKLETLIAVQENALTCLEQIKANTAAITGIETSLGQIGCTEDGEGNITGSVLVCKVSDTTTDPVTDTIKVWWFGLDGTVVEDYDGPYVACTNLQALANILENILAKTTSTPLLWGVQVDTNFVDNHSNGEPPYGIVAYPIDDHHIVLNLSDGTTCEFDIPATGPGTYPAWNEALAAGIATCTGKPWARASRPADGNPSTPVGNHAAAECCPGDLTVVSATATVTSETRNGRIVPLLTGVIKGELEKYLQFTCLGSADVWTDLDGNVVEKPDLTCAALNCQFPGPNPCGCPKTVTCSFERFPGCVIQNPEDEETGLPEVVQQNVFQRFETCDGKTTIVTFSIDGDDEVPVELTESQYFGDCETLLPPDYEPECPEDCDWLPMSLVEHHATWDNTEYRNPTVAAIKAGDTLEFELGDGSTQQLVITGNSLFQPKAFFESLGCTVSIHCDNWVINGEDRCSRFPAWTTGKTKCPEFANLVKDDVYAAYLIITHCDPGKLPVNTTIIASDREGVAGATHHSVHCMTSEMVTACYKCSGTIVKDCDNKIIEVDPKCLRAPKTEVCDVDLLALLESMKTTKSGGIEGANYDGAFAFTTGRPDPNVSWAVVNNNDPDNQFNIIEGATLAEFSADAESKGYTQFIVGEIHYLCPCPADMPAVATGNYFVEAGGDTLVKPGCTPLTELEGVPVKLPTESQCALRVLDCNSDAMLAAQQQMLDKLCQMLEGDDMGTAKLCLIEDALTGVCPQDVLVLDKELQTLTIAGDVTENYATAGQNIDLQNANGESCGAATVASPAVLNEAGDTVITLEECELDEGKEPVQITQAKPVAVATVRAIQTVKTLTAAKLSREVVVKEPVEETPVRG